MDPGHWFSGAVKLDGIASVLTHRLPPLIPNSLALIQAASYRKKHVALQKDSRAQRADRSGS